MSTKYDERMIEENKIKQLRSVSGTNFWIVLDCLLTLGLFAANPPAMEELFIYPLNIFVSLFLTLISIGLVVLTLYKFSSRSTNPASMSAAPADTPSFDIKANTGIFDAKAKVESISQTEKELLSQLEHSTFHINEPLLSEENFYGRKDIYIDLIRRIRNRQSTLLVGPAKMGKTWIIQYLKLTAERNVGLRYHIAHLAVTYPGSSPSIALMNRALELFGRSDLITNSADVVQSVNALKQATSDLKKDGKIPVLCIDEFERFNDLSFNADFFKDLRGVVGSGLVLIICSRTLIAEIKGDDGKQAKTSQLENILKQIEIGPFNGQEAEEFLKGEGGKMGLTRKQCDLLKLYSELPQGKWSPLRLQLAGQMLLEDQDRFRNDDSYWYNPKEESIYWPLFKERLERAYDSMVPKEQAEKVIAA